MPAFTNRLSQLIFAATTAIILTACNEPAQDPKIVADNYWKYLQSGNTLEAEKLVTINSRRNIAQHITRIDNAETLTTGESKTIVTTTITTINPETQFKNSEQFETVLLLEQGQWKVDVDQSTIPPLPTAKEEELQKLAVELSESMQENIDSIDDAMNQGMHMLNDALRDGSKEMGDSLLHLMNELNHSMKESIEKMKERRHQQMDKQNPPPKQTPPDSKQGEGMI